MLSIPVIPIVSLSLLLGCGAGKRERPAEVRTSNPKPKREVPQPRLLNIALGESPPPRTSLTPVRLHLIHSQNQGRAFAIQLSERAAIIWSEGPAISSLAQHLQNVRMYRVREHFALLSEASPNSKAVRNEFFYHGLAAPSLIWSTVAARRRNRASVLNLQGSGVTRYWDAPSEETSLSVGSQHAIGEWSLTLVDAPDPVIRLRDASGRRCFFVSSRPVRGESLVKPNCPTAISLVERGIRIAGLEDNQRLFVTPVSDTRIAIFDFAPLGP
jgi:hypothetical protein